MKVEDLLKDAQGEATAEYEVVVERPGVRIGNQPSELLTIGRVHRDTANKRLVLEVDDVIPA